MRFDQHCAFLLAPIRFSVNVTLLKTGIVMKIKITACAAALTLCVTPALADSDAGGAGANECSLFIELYDNFSSEERETLLLGTEQWALGYWTGLNIRVDKAERRNLDSMVNSNAGYQILQICRSSPGAKLYEVATAIYLNLPMYNAVSS